LGAVLSMPAIAFQQAERQLTHVLDGVLLTTELTYEALKVLVIFGIILFHCLLRYEAGNENGLP
jgi:hypothetical protein